MTKDTNRANAKRSAAMKKWHMEHDHPMKGKKHTGESLAKMSASHKRWIKKHGHSMQGRHLSEETKARKSAGMKEWHKTHDHPMLDKNHSPESLAKMRRRTQSLETRAKISKAMAGRKPSDETRKKMSESANSRDPAYKARISAALKGRPKSPEHRAKLAAAARGRKASEEARRNMSRAHAGFRHTDEAKAKISRGNRGKKRTQKTKANMRASFKDRATPEYRAKQASAHAGKKDSPETVRKKSASGKRRYARMSEKEKRELSRKRNVGGEESDPERCVRAVLDMAGVQYLEQEPLEGEAAGNAGDFFVEPSTVIEVRGTYPHADPRKYPDASIYGRLPARDVRAKDAERSRLLKKAGYREIVVWQLDLQRRTAETAARLLDQLGVPAPDTLKRCSYVELVRAAGTESRDTRLQ